MTESQDQNEAQVSENHETEEEQEPETKKIKMLETPDENETCLMKESEQQQQQQQQQLQQPAMMMMKRRRRVSIVMGGGLEEACQRFPIVPSRVVMMTHSLIHALTIKPQEEEQSSLINIIKTKAATIEEMEQFHSTSFLQALQSLSAMMATDGDDGCGGGEEEDGLKVKEMKEEFGLEDDCHPFEGMFEHCCLVAGGSLQMAEELVSGRADIAINWAGGRHHSHSEKASGFCFVNDVVLAIQRLMACGSKRGVRNRAFERVLYVDLDIHHGDGVQEAFYYSPQVMKVSLHKYEPGFFPGTGSEKETGAGRGKGFTMNVTFNGNAVTDEEYCSKLKEAIRQIKEERHFAADVVVMVCGSDCIGGDPLGGWSSTTVNGMVKCVKMVMDEWKEVPMLMLGGGGYSDTTASRYHSLLTWLAVHGHDEDNVVFPKEIPEHPFFPKYGPDFVF